MKVLILDDARIGHRNQSIAFARLIGAEFHIASVRYINKRYKPVSYFLDRLGILSASLFECNVPDERFDYVVSAGSTCAYPLKVIARRLGIQSVSMMLPKGYRYDGYDIIFAQSHDNPPERSNVIRIPANFSYPEPKKIYVPSKKSVGIVIGGDNSVFSIDETALSKALEQISRRFGGYEIAVTTSPRTSARIEQMIESLPCDYRIIYSKTPLNPIPDFLEQCEYVFITQDSTSMISEAVGFGDACIEILPLKSDGQNKFVRLVKSLETDGYLHVFDGTCGNAKRKIDFSHYIRAAGVVG